MPNKDRLLNFEQFIKRKNSFHMHFVGLPGGHMIGDAYRKNRAYQRCLQERPAFQKLVDELRPYYEPGKPVFAETTALQKKLHEAYQLMHPFAASNEDLFR